MEDSGVEPMSPSVADRASRLLDQTEKVYLASLRVAVLLIATLIIVYAAGLALVSLYRVAQNPSSVVVEDPSVRPDEVLSGGTAEATKGSTETKTNATPQQIKAYRGFVNSYYQVFHNKFEPFRQRDDKQLTVSEFDDNFVSSESRIAAVAGGSLDFEKDIGELRKLLDAMSKAAALPETGQRLAKYKSAKKIQVCHAVERTRTTYVQGWDRYSTSCSNWYDNPIGCSVRRPISTPYKSRECSMQFPDGTVPHLQLFRDYQDRYFQLLTQRRDDAAASAEAKRLSIMQGIAKGKADLFAALLATAGFIVLMFFFLLIAIERHQRKLHGGLPTTADTTGHPS